MHSVFGHDLPKTADAVIIGGGSTGANVAYQLTRLGVRNVVLLERGAMASGVTGRSGAQLIPRSENPTVARLKWEGVQFYRRMAAERPDHLEFFASGYVAVAPREQAHSLADDISQMAALGSAAAQVDRDELRTICPNLQLDDEEVALTIPEAGFLDPAATVRCLTSLAAADGLRAFELAPASIHLQGDHVASVSTPLGEIATGAVIVAAGVWSNEVLNPIGAGLPIFWHRAQVCYYQRPIGFADHPIVGDFTHRFYFRPELGRLTMAGSIPQMQPGARSPKGLDGLEHPDALKAFIDFETMQTLLDKLTRRAPRFAEGYWRRGHACVYDVTPDWHPIFSFEESVGGLFCAAGFSGHGFVLGPAAGRLAAAAVVGDDSSSADRHLFRLRRFAGNEPIAFEIG